MKTTGPPALVLVLLVLAACGTEADFDVGEPGQVESPLVSTYYRLNSTSSRTVCAYRTGVPGTFRLKATWRSLWDSRCYSGEWSMSPPTTTTSQTCASLGLAYVVTAGVSSCNTSAGTPANVECRTVYVSGREFNYKTDAIGGGVVVDSSGWIPLQSNGCPRP